METEFLSQDAVQAFNSKVSNNVYFNLSEAQLSAAAEQLKGDKMNSETVTLFTISESTPNIEGVLVGFTSINTKYGLADALIIHKVIERKNYMVIVTETMTNFYNKYKNNPKILPIKISFVGKQRSMSGNEYSQVEIFTGQPIS